MADQPPAKILENANEDLYVLSATKEIIQPSAHKHAINGVNNLKFSLRSLKMLMSLIKIRTFCEKQRGKVETSPF